MGNYKTYIKKAIEKNSFGLYVGAGLSMGAGLPSWEKLLSNLIDQIESMGTTSSEKIGELRSLIKDSSKYLMVAEEIREIIPTYLERYVRDVFDSNEHNPTSAHEKLVSVKSKFVITTNYDTLIEKAFVKVHNAHYPKVFSYKDASSVNYNLWNDEYFILKSHGDARNAPSEIVLTEKDYRKIIYQQQGYQSILHAIFSTNTILFVGVSLNDPELLLLLGYIHNIFHGGSPTHYALLSEGSISKTEIHRWRTDYNIECILYDPANNHKQVENILDDIISENGVLQFN